MEAISDPPSSLSLRQLRKDLRTAARELSDAEARYLVDAYYQIQDYRKASHNQVRSLAKSGEPTLTLDYFGSEYQRLEGEIKRVLDSYTDTLPMGRWLKSLTGIGPVIAAGLVAHIDIDRAPTVAHIWNYAGLNPGITWEKGKKRPWNADLKVLCWKAGESFNKQKSRPSDFYGKLLDQRKLREWHRNVRGELADQACSVLKQKRFKKDTEAYKWYAASYDLDPDCVPLLLDVNTRAGLMPDRDRGIGNGTPMLPPAHIHARAARWVVKLFLSHLHAVWYAEAYEAPPLPPYAMIYTGHADLILPPNVPEHLAGIMATYSSERYIAWCRSQAWEEQQQRQTQETESEIMDEVEEFEDEDEDSGEPT